MIKKILHSNFYRDKIYFYFKYLLTGNTYFFLKTNKKRSGNLIIGAAYNYNFVLIRNFINSIAKNYKDDLILIVNKENLGELKKNISYKRIHYMGHNVNPLNGNINRYQAYLKILSLFKNKKNILLTDTRDVIIQKNPFKNFKYKIALGKENLLYKNDQWNKKKFKRFFGDDEYKKLINKRPLCSGVIIGQKKYIIKLIKDLIPIHKNIIKKIYYLFSFPRGIDNSTINYIIYKKYKKIVYLSDTYKDHLIGTYANFSIKLIKTKKNHIVNKYKQKICIIHQYDRLIHKHKELDKIFKNYYLT